MSKNKIEIATHIAYHALEILREDIIRTLAFLSHETNPAERQILHARLEADQNDVVVLIEALKENLYKERVAAKSLQSKSKIDAQNMAKTSIDRPDHHDRQVRPVWGGAGMARDNKENISPQETASNLKSSMTAANMVKDYSKPKPKK